MLYNYQERIADFQNIHFGKTLYKARVRAPNIGYVLELNQSKCRKNWEKLEP